MQNKKIETQTKKHVLAYLLGSFQIKNIQTPYQPKHNHAYKISRSQTPQMFWVKKKQTPFEALLKNR